MNKRRTSIGSLESIQESYFESEMKNNKRYKKRKKRKKKVKFFFVIAAFVTLFFVWLIGRLIEFIFVGAVDLLKTLF